jgi:hypothetical protein
MESAYKSVIKNDLKKVGSGIKRFAKFYAEPFDHRRDLYPNVAYGEDNNGMEQVAGTSMVTVPLALVLLGLSEQSGHGLYGFAYSTAPVFLPMIPPAIRGAAYRIRSHYNPKTGSTE